jgi:hypothetical protein
MGSPALTKTIGITNVTSFAARPEWAPPTATITGTCRAIRSDASDSNAHIGSRPSDISIPTSRPSTMQSTSRRLMKAAVRSLDSSRALVLRNPILGISFCSAGNADEIPAAVPASKPKKCRRPSSSTALRPVAFENVFNAGV